MMGGAGRPLNENNCAAQPATFLEAVEPAAVVII
jgi:hypothetical protein